MPNVSTLIIQFGNEIEFQDITHFRGALIASLERTDVLFHNHEGDKLRYSYPLIQYKRIHKKAAVMGIGKGAEAVTYIKVYIDKNGFVTYAKPRSLIGTEDNELTAVINKISDYFT